MAALNPWKYRRRDGRFTKRRKGARRTWVRGPGRARRRSKRGGRRASLRRMPAGLRKYWARKWGISRVGVKRRRKSPGKRRRYGGTGHGYTRSYRKRKPWLVAHRGKRRYKKRGGRRVLESYGPQLPRTRAQRRQYYVGVARAARAGGRQLSLFGRSSKARRPKRAPRHSGGVILDQYGRVASNPRRRRRNGMRRYATTVNPRRRRVRGFRRVRRHLYTRNPGIGSIVQMAKNSIMPAAAGFGGGLICGFIDTKLLPKKRLMQGLAKFVLGLGGAFLLRKKPMMASAFVGSTLGTVGYGFGIRMGGGQVAGTKGEVLAGLADMAAEDPELANLISNAEDLGDLVTAGELADGEVELADDEDLADLVAE